MQEVFKCKHFVATYIKSIQSRFKTTAVIDATEVIEARWKLYASFFLISHDETTWQLSTAVKINETVEKKAFKAKVCGSQPITFPRNSIE